MPKDPLDVLNPKIETVEEQEQKPEVLEKVVDEILSVKQIETKTDLSDRLIIAMARLDAYGSIFDLDIIKALSFNVKKLRISRNRLGRKELTDMTRNLVAMEQAPTEQSMISQLFKGNQKL